MTSLNALLRRSLNAIVGLNGSNSSFHYNGCDLSLLMLSSVTKAIESYCGIANANTPFFDLVREMEDTWWPEAKRRRPPPPPPPPPPTSTPCAGR